MRFWRPLWKSAFLFLFIFATAVSCSKKEYKQLQLVQPQAGRVLESYALVATKAMVVTPHEEISKIGLDVLKQGGNAADAAIAISFALAVMRPQSTGLGGGGFLLFYNKEANKTVALDFREFAPMKATRDMYIKDGKADTDLSQIGALSVAVPRLVAGLGYVYEHYASQKVSWGALLMPAIRLAQEGFQVYPHLAESIQEETETLNSFPSSKAIFLPKGEPPKVGDLLIQKELARTLMQLANWGWSYFYRGDIAGNIIGTIQRHGGIITPQDFQFVAPTEMEPSAGNYRDYKIYSMPPPSSGGIVLVEILNILENFSIGRWGPSNPKTVHVVAEAMKRGFLDRAHYLGDPRFVKIPIRGLLTKEYAESHADSISLKRATPSPQLSPVKFQAVDSDSTTHFSIVDSQGNALASTQTINGIFGSGLVAQGTGVVLNNEMDDFSVQPGVPNAYGLVGNEANAIAPGKVPLSSMSPTLVFDESGQLRYVLGTPGGPKIISGVLMTLLNLIDFQASPLEAVAAKRYHHQWLPDQLQAEVDFLPAVLSKELVLKGHRVEERPFSSLVMLVARSQSGWIGVSDPRGIGKPAGW